MTLTFESFYSFRIQSTSPSFGHLFFLLLLLHVRLKVTFSVSMWDQLLFKGYYSLNLLMGNVLSWKSQTRTANADHAGASSHELRMRTS